MHKKAQSDALQAAEGLSKWLRHKRHRLPMSADKEGVGSRF